MQLILFLAIVVVSHVSGHGDPPSFVGLVKQYCNALHDPGENATWSGPPGPRGSRGEIGARGPPGMINETKIIGIIEQEIQKALPIFRNISELLVDNNDVAQQTARKYMERFAGKDGWTVFQRRMDGSVDFYRGWDDYVNGFGNRNGEFWLGLEDIHRLTRGGVHELRIDMIERDGTYYRADYRYFEVGPAVNNYVLRLSGYNGNATDSLKGHNGEPFSTKDADHDTCDCNCAENYLGGWWYNLYNMRCHQSNLNGKYHKLDGSGLIWKWDVYRYKYGGPQMVMRFTEMKFRLRA